ncbi:hypothetical protein MNEG_1095 [Monoraphidium neglectum]|uniref:IST1-like protein n=1 Tax=Monoraphidium neglectum TaxID=145388 RepID=A0A0D2K9E9_9CHLO|nr:hypothetical protein MNEG_1095 [Monoraphidium neglectum]KIZ06863.1 hypothetical protein MNEG_1095 [Monoraphidium neglectum]|eukprot:XP_013905882.1 hypothetical protein MNEG_1095 [Monoraphidium neglectum]
MVANYRKDIAELLKTGKQDYARIRVEAVIRESLTLQAYDILELFLELLAMRAPLVANTKEVPRDMTEALSSVLYCASRRVLATRSGPRSRRASLRVPDLPELLTLHKIFAQKYGKEYVQSASSDTECHRWNVNERLRRCVTVEPPEASLKLEVLSEIAQEFKVEWDLDRARREMLPPDGISPGPPPGASGGYGGGYGGASGSGGGGGGGGAVYGGPPPLQMQGLGPGPAAGVPPVGRPGVYQDARQAAAAAAAAAAEAQRAADTASAPADLGNGYRQRSQEEIQRAYDSAAGPPAKPDLDAPPAPAAPPAAPAAPPAPPAAPAAPPAEGAGNSGASEELDLPAAPRLGGPAAPSGGDSEFDELQKRFDALKRQ